MRRALLSLPFVTALTTLSCYPLQTLKEGVCGNGVIEPEQGEDCEPAGYEVFTCREPGDALECTIECGVGGLCPRGHGCSADNTCRKPGGTFSFEPFVLAGSQASGLLAGDFDADGRDDIVAVEPGKARIYFTDASGGVEQTTVTSILPPAIGTLGPLDGATPDSTDDLVLPLDIGFGALLSEGNRSFRNKTYGSLSLDSLPIGLPENPGDEEVTVALRKVVRAVPLPIDGVFAFAPPGSADETAALVRITRGDGEPGSDTTETTLLIDLGEGGPRTIFPLNSTTLEDLAGPPVGGNFDDDPCEELVVPTLGATSLSVYKLCKNAGKAGGYNWAVQATEKDATLVNVAVGGSIAGPVFARDVDQDGLLDLVISAGASSTGAAELRVAYGTGKGTFHSAPPMGVPVPDNSAGPYAELKNGAPLAFEMLAGQGSPERAVLVDKEGIQRGVAPMANAASITLNPWFEVPRTWTDAAIADVNGDGHLDVVASSDGATDIDVLLGNPSGFWNPSQIATDGTVGQISTGDFDGDLVGDILFDDVLTVSTSPDEVSSSGPSSGTESRIRIAYGRTSGGPEEPRDVGTVETVERLLVGHIHRFGADNISDLGVVSRTGGRTAFSFFPGTATRLLQAPLVLSDELSGAHRPLATATVMLPAEQGVKARLDVVVLSFADPGNQFKDPAMHLDGAREYASAMRIWALFGGASDADFDRAVSSRCKIDGAFRLPGQPQVHSIAASPSSADEPGTVFVTMPYLPNVMTVNSIDAVDIASVIGRVSIGATTQPEEAQPCWPDLSGYQSGKDVHVSDPGQIFSRIATADLNQDGDPDVVAIRTTYDPESLRTSVQEQILGIDAPSPGNTAEEPSAAPISEVVVFWGPDMDNPYPLVGGPTTVRDFTVGDIDGNGIPDLLVLDDEKIHWFEQKPETVAALELTPADNEVEFDPARKELQTNPFKTIQIPAEGGQAILLSDADGDGILDLALRSDSSLRVFKGEPPNPTGGSTGDDEDAAQPRQ